MWLNVLRNSCTVPYLFYTHSETDATAAVLVEHLENLIDEDHRLLFGHIVQLQYVVLGHDPRGAGCHKPAARRKVISLNIKDLMETDMNHSLISFSSYLVCSCRYKMSSWLSCGALLFFDRLNRRVRLPGKKTGFIFLFLIISSYDIL